MKDRHDVGTGRLDGVVIVVIDIGLDGTIAEIARELDSMMRQLAEGGGAAIEIDETTIGGREARRYLLQVSGRDELLINEQILVAFAGRLYNVTCQSREDLFRAVQANCQTIYDTFTFTD